MTSPATSQERAFLFAIDTGKGPYFWNPGTGQPASQYVSVIVAFPLTV